MRLLAYVLCIEVLVNSKSYESDDEEKVEHVIKERDSKMSTKDSGDGDLIPVIDADVDHIEDVPNPDDTTDDAFIIKEEIRGRPERVAKREAESLSLQRSALDEPKKVEIPKIVSDRKYEEEIDFPLWIFLLLVPLVVTLIIAIGCFAFYKRAYDKVAKENEEKKAMEKAIQSKKEADERQKAGLPMSALDLDPTGHPVGIKVMRDPDLDSAAREEAPRVYRMIYTKNKWKTVDRVPSDMSFEIPSDSFCAS
ncbi:unnamed protein product [Cylicocyclus nassatus]|uniref:Uncharacterized protein n=1 Tax=Cylicocyclus nassatus TaxID=53992 RepID=A0AA36M7D3_CYLNA|nr:unnamed protein product [Cylicocyclus nassatus]